VSVRDARRPPFWYVTHDAIDTLHDVFPVGEGRKDAMAVCAALAALASRCRGRGGGDGFEATRTDVAEYAGVSLSTLDRVSRRMADAGLLTVEAEYRTAPKTWTLLDAPSARTAQAAADEAPVEVASLRHPDDNSAGSLRQGDDNLSSGGRKPLRQGDASSEALSYAGADEATEEQRKQQRETRAPAAEICDRMTARFGSRHDPWHAEQLLVEDGRDLAVVLELIDWIADDPFWGGRCRTVPNLRRFWDQLLAVRNGGTSPAGPAGNGRAARARPPGPDPGHCCAIAGSEPQPAEAEWKHLARQLRREVPTDSFELWLAHCHPHAGTDGELLIAAPRHIRATAEQRFRKLIAAIAGRPVQFVTCQEETP